MLENYKETNKHSILKQMYLNKTIDVCDELYQKSSLEKKNLPYRPLKI